MLITKTERLSIRRFHTGDAPFVLSLLNTPGWLQYIGDNKIRTLPQAEAYIRNGPIKSYEKFGFGLYLVSLKATVEPIGMCGILKRDTLEHADIGFAFLPQYIGKGYAFESASSILAYAQPAFNIPKIAAITLPENKSSISLLERLGLGFEKIIQFPGETEELMLYGKTF